VTKGATVRDAEATKRRILAAGEKEFAAKGIAGARVDAIADLARTNKRMIYYYFGSKDGLFRAVLHEHLVARVAELSKEPGTRVQRLLKRQRSHARDRSYVRMLTWEALEDDRRRTLAGEEDREATYHDWVESIRAEQQAGLVRADLDPAQLVLSELALTVFPVAFPQLTRLITGRSPNDPELLERREAFLRSYAEAVYAPQSKSRVGRSSGRVVT